MSVYFLGALMTFYVFTAIYQICRRWKSITCVLSKWCWFRQDFELWFLSLEVVNSEKKCWEERVIRNRTEDSICFQTPVLNFKKNFEAIQFYMDYQLQALLAGFLHSYLHW